MTTPQHTPGMSAWLFNIRPLTLRERISVGFQLWWTGVAKYPWPVAQVRPVEWNK